MNETNETALVEPKEALVELLKVPSEKPTRMQKIVGSPSRRIGLALLALIWISSLIHYVPILKQVNLSRMWSGANTTHHAPTVNRSFTITKGVWSEPVIVGDYEYRTISVTPPVERWVMVDDDPHRVYPIAAFNDKTTMGKGKSIRSMIRPEAQISTAVVEYSLR